MTYNHSNTKSQIKLITLLLIFTIQFQLINTQDSSNTCLSASTCNTSTKPLKCSLNGHCYIDLLNPKQQYDTVNYEKCICNRGWGTLKTDEISCCYAQKSKFMAFLFEFVLGFGIGHLYMGRMINFYIKFFLKNSNMSAKEIFIEFKSSETFKTYLRQGSFSCKRCLKIGS